MTALIKPLEERRKKKRYRTKRLTHRRWLRITSKLDFTKHLFPKPKGLLPSIIGGGSGYLRRGGGSGGNWQFSAGQFYPTVYSLEIYFPKASIGTANYRPYKSYPNKDYNIRVASAFGSYPHYYTLTTAPSGMTINKWTGEINWPAASTNTAGTGPHTVTVRVRDQDGGDQSVTWSITNSTAGFVHVDSTVGTSGDGSAGSPFKTLQDLYEGSDGSEIAIFYAGTYDNEFLTTGYSAGHYWNPALHTAVWMANPGDTCTLTFASNRITFGGAIDYNVYIDNFTIDASSMTDQQCFNMNGGPSSIGSVYRRITCSGLSGTAGQNPGYLTCGTSASGRGQNHVFQDCSGSSVGLCTGVLVYAQTKVLVEDCNFSNIDVGISPKDSCYEWDIRGNTTHDCDWGIEAQGYSTRGNGGKMVVRHNSIRQNNPNTSGPYGLIFNTNADAGFDGFYFVRNTLYGTSNSWADGLPSNPVYAENVILNNNTGWTDRIKLAGTTVEGDVTKTNNLSGATTDGIVDASNLLTGSSRTTYLGTRGHELVYPS